MRDEELGVVGIGVLCQLGCEGPFRAEVIRWMPGYTDPLDPIPDDDDDAAEGVDGPAESLNGTTREPDGAADALNGAAGEPDGTAGSLNGITREPDGAATPGRDDPDDARAGAVSPNG